MHPGAKLDMCLAQRGGVPLRTFSRSLAMKRFHNKVGVRQNLEYRWGLLKVGSAHFCSVISAKLLGRCIRLKSGGACSFNVSCFLTVDALAYRESLLDIRNLQERSNFRWGRRQSVHCLIAVNSAEGNRRDRMVLIGYCSYNSAFAAP